MNLSCYIIDDEDHAIELLADHIAKTPGLELGASFTNPLEAIAKFREGARPDITFLDIDMPELSGLEVSEIIEEHTKVIFTSAFSEYAVSAFDKRLSDFLLKPISYPRFLQAIDKIAKKPGDQAQGNDDTFFINPGVKGKIVGLKYSAINYIEGMKNYISIFTGNDERHITYLTMKEITEAIPTTQFVRVHKSYIVNINKIKYIDGTHVTLNDSSKVPIGSSYKEELMQKLDSKILRSGR